eukprot:TRINITY_DN27414_c0_g1_i1.p1 TRINITY_DN27414_c0_g1~~TRINITY_DN27414_c0_g1_i1.p1  ORF type:complete len:413 (-),score=60.32 TRINITY_DN27414_c0_g1_i1:13-1251(-)
MPGKRQAKPKASDVQLEPLNPGSELSDEQLSNLAQQLSPLAAEDGRIPIAILLGQTLGIARIEDRALKRLDKEKTGYTTLESVIAYCYPGVPRTRIQDFFAKDLHVDAFLLLRQAFSEIAVKGKLTAARLSELGMNVGGHYLSLEAFSKLEKVSLGFTDAVKGIFPSLNTALVEQYTASRVTVDQYLTLKDFYEGIDAGATGRVTLQQVATVAAGAPFYIDLETLQKADVSEISFPYLLRAVYPSLSDRIIRVYHESYTPELRTEFRRQRESLEEEESIARESLLAEELRRFGKIEQAQASASTPGGEYGGEGDPPGTADSNNSVDEPTVSDAMRQRRERDARDRAAIEAIEDGDRWNLIVEEHRQRLRFGELMTVAHRQALADQRARAFLAAAALPGPVAAFSFSASRVAA